MRVVLIIAIITTLLLPVLFSMAVRSEETAGPPPEAEAVTMAEEYGLNRAQIASFDAGLSARLVRFGLVAQKRGKFVEAKRYFWKALLVDPTSKLAWMYYDQAVVQALASEVPRVPALIGLPGLSSDPDAVPVQAPPEEEEGC